VGIEIGYAFAKQIPIIYLHKENAEYSTTASGSASHSIMYHNETDLVNKLNRLF
jgi:nucleoside 2-deoxyribosyltransferase